MHHLYAKFCNPTAGCLEDIIWLASGGGAFLVPKVGYRRLL